MVEWASRIAEDPAIDSATVERHLSQLCTSANFGEWAHAFGRKGGAPSWSYLKRGMRNAYADASWKQKIDGIFVALGCDLKSESTVVNGDLGAQLTETDKERLVDAVVTYHGEKIRSGDRLKNGQRALGLLGLASVSQLLARRITAWKKELANTAVFSGTPSETLARPTFTAVATIVLRSRECRDLESYLTDEYSVV